MSYESGLYEWAKEQAAALRRRASNELDWDNLAEEIETLGHSNVDQMEVRLENPILHLLKWKYQPELRCGSWRGSIFEARRRTSADQEVSVARIFSERISARGLSGRAREGAARNGTLPPAGKLPRVDRANPRR